jgi:hypothetical protein
VNSSDISIVKCQHPCRKDLTRLLLVQRLFTKLPAKLTSDSQAIQMRLNSFIQA